MEWISVSDRLPTKESDMNVSNYVTKDVIIATKHFVSFDSFVAGNTVGFWSQFKDYKKEVTHWMPLPDPPEK